MSSLSPVLSTPLMSCTWLHHKKSRLSKTHTDSITGLGEQVDKKQTHPANKPRDTVKRRKQPTRNISTAQMQKDPRQTSKGRERGEMFQYKTDQLQTKPQPERISHVGSEAVSPRKDTCITHITHKAFSFLPPPFVSSQGFQLKWGGWKLVHEFTTNSACFCVWGSVCLLCG